MWIQKTGRIVEVYMNMTEYRAIYKCRLCGEEYVSAIAGSADMAIKNMVVITVEFDSGQRILNPVTKLSMHSCKDGSMGLADFLGFRKVEDGNEADRKMENQGYKEETPGGIYSAES